MEKIASFTIDHIKLQPGIYVSRKDHVGNEVITTFDIRMTSPNEEPVMNTAEVHTIEHLAATFLRNHKEFGSRIIYFGPMGCRTGFYLLLAGDYESSDIVELLKDMFVFIRDFKDEVPGASPKDCGNYLDMNLGMANELAKKYLDEVLNHIGSGPSYISQLNKSPARRTPLLKFSHLFAVKAITVLAGLFCLVKRYIRIFSYGMFFFRTVPRIEGNPHRQ